LKYKITIALVFSGLFYLTASALAHDTSQHLDPDLLAGWLTWVHLTIQWSHLTVFALWFGLTIGTLLLGVKASLDRLLHLAWMFLLIILATGNYNMEYSAGISETPSLISLPLLVKIPYGVTYTAILAVKLGLYVLVVLITGIITLLHLWAPLDKNRLRRIFLIFQSVLTVFIALVTATVLFYHEVADLWPTAVHSLGGVVAPEGPRGQTLFNQNMSPPNDFRLLMTSVAWIDIATRWAHLLGFGLWFGASAAALVLTPVSAARFLSVSWIALLLQISSGVMSMDHWTPFYRAPYFWNLDSLSHIRFGRSYTLFMTAKHILVSAIAVLMIIWSIRYLRLLRKNKPLELSVRSLAGVNFFIGLIIGYIMIILLFLHEGVDHAL
jgi:hypothetical protein